MTGMFSKSEETHTTADQQSNTFLGTTVHIEGTVKSDEDIIIAGTINGAIQTAKNMTVRSGAHIEADVTAHDILISGEIHGNIRATGTATLTQTARIVGDVAAAHIAIEHGASLKGQITTEAQ